MFFCVNPAQSNGIPSGHDILARNVRHFRMSSLFLSEFKVRISFCFSSFCINTFCMKSGVIQQDGVDQVVVQHQVGLGQTLRGAHRNQARIAGAGADKIDFTAVVSGCSCHASSTWGAVLGEPTKKACPSTRAGLSARNQTAAFPRRNAPKCVVVS